MYANLGLTNQLIKKRQVEIIVSLKYQILIWINPSQCWRFVKKFKDFNFVAIEASDFQAEVA